MWNIYQQANCQASAAVARFAYALFAAGQCLRGSP